MIKCISMTTLKKLEQNLLPAIGLLTIILFIFFNPAKVLLLIYILGISSLYFFKRKNDLIYLFISSVISLVWVIFVSDLFLYTRPAFTIFGLNSFILFAWALGLFAAYKISTYYIKKLKIKNKLSRFLFLIILYWVFLISVETIAYHLFGMQNLTAAAYPGIPICNCMHAQPWMQLSYFLLGPIYFIALKVFKVR